MWLARLHDIDCRRAATFCLFFLLHCTVLQSQAENYRLEKIPLTGELSNLVATCMLQDSEGYMWLGSENGLYRYDGRESKRKGRI